MCFCNIFLFYILFFVGVLFGESKVFFSPEDKISTELIKCINRSENRIYAAVYMLTDKHVAKALIDAKNNRGLDVQIVTDKSSLECEHGQIDLLKENGIEVFVFKPQVRKNKTFNEIMHNKFALFDKKVWTGSFNWTVAASKRNKENVICTDDAYICQKYERQFEDLKKSCIKTNKNCRKNKRYKPKKGLEDQGLKDKIMNFFDVIKSKFK